MKSRTWDYIAITCIIIGAINWGLVGFFQLDLVAFVFGGMSSWISRVIYAIIGIAGLYALTLYGRVYDEPYSNR